MLTVYQRLYRNLITLIPQLETPVEGHGHGRDIAILRKLRGG